MRKKVLFGILQKSFLKVYFCNWYVTDIRRHQIFLGGPRKIFGAPPARKKRGSQIFRLRRAFFRRGGTENR